MCNHLTKKQPELVIVQNQDRVDDELISHCGGRSRNTLVLSYTLPAAIEILRRLDIAVLEQI
jgi:hypothetical protein